MKRTALLFAAAALAGCAGSRPAPEKSEAVSPAVPPLSAGVRVEDTIHGVRYELPPADGWQLTGEGGARLGAGPIVEVGSFPLAKPGSSDACRESARGRLAFFLQRASDEEEQKPAEGEQTAARDVPRDQTTGESPTATWSFTRGPAAAPLRSRWAFFPRGADCLMLEVTGPRGDPLTESVFTTAARSFQPLPLNPEQQREVDLLAGMGFLERREPAAALERFELLTRREPGFAKAHFGALMAGFELGASAYTRALPHGELALKAERELTPEQRQLALRAVGVMQLAENQVRHAAQTLAELVVRVPELAEGQYNYACALARLGDAEGAIDHLRSAVKLDRELAGHAREDEDLRSLRGSGAFEQVLAAPPSGPSGAAAAHP